MKNLDQWSVLPLLACACTSSVFVAGVLIALALLMQIAAHYAQQHEAAEEWEYA